MMILRKKVAATIAKEGGNQGQTAISVGQWLENTSNLAGYSRFDNSPETMKLLGIEHD